MSQILCDGCGRPASAEHLSLRLRRLELATRFRPIHIHVLFLMEAPPPRLEDYFYFVPENGAAARTQRAEPWSLFFDSLLTGAGILLERGKSDEACLGEFQRHGHFLAEAIECPAEEAESGRASGGAAPRASEPLLLRLAPTMIKRIQFSYKPRHIAIVSPGLVSLIPLLKQADLGDRLLLHDGRPLPFPRSASSANHFRTLLAELLASTAGRANGTC